MPDVIEVMAAEAREELRGFLGPDWDAVDVPEFLAAILSAAERAGYVLVPVEPSSDMVEYGRQDQLNPDSLDWIDLGVRSNRNTLYQPSLVRRIWERMIAACDSAHSSVGPAPEVKDTHNG